MKQAVIEANIILPLVQLLQHAEFDIKKEAAWAISNATSGGSHEQIQYGFLFFSFFLFFIYLIFLVHNLHVHSLASVPNINPLEFHTGCL